MGKTGSERTTKAREKRERERERRGRLGLRRHHSFPTAIVCKLFSFDFNRNEGWPCSNPVRSQYHTPINDINNNL